MRKPALKWLTASMLMMACSGSAHLSGEVFVAGPSGERRPGAEVDVVLVPASAAFEVEWGQVVEGFRAHRTRVLAMAKEAEGAQAHASAERVAASQAALSLLARGDGVDWKAYDQATDRQTDAVARSLRAAQRGQAARKQLDTLAARYRRDAWALIAKYQAKRVRTDARGHFEFAGTPPGRYVLASRVPVSGGEQYWLVPVELTSSVKQTADLTDRNAGWPLS